MNRSLLEAGGSALVVSQFTLVRRHTKRAGGRRSSSAATPDQAEPLVAYFGQALAFYGRAGADRHFPDPHAGRDRQRRAGDDHPRER